MHGSGYGRATGGRAGRGHTNGSSVGGSMNGRKAQLTSAYASLAAELTRKEIKCVGGYTLGRTIGEGSFGTVRIGVHRLTNTRVAVKQVPKSLPFSSDPSSPLSLLTREIHHHRRLRHPHILALYEIIATESSIYLITELCTGGELFDYLVEKGRLLVGETRRIFGQLVLGVAHLHQSGVVHRDLKLENVLLDERVNVKIADLGFGREFEKGRWMETWVGTLGYCAPEVVAAKRYLGEEVDIWSLGVILYTLLAGSLPFDDDDEAIMKEKILKCDYDIPNWLDEDAADLIISILQLDPLRRPSLKAILSHRFFTRPPPAPTYESRRTASPHLAPHESFPPVIPEETSIDSPTDELPNAFDRTPLPASPPLQASPPLPSHTLAASDISDASFFSASGSDAGQSRSGATTPITSDDGEPTLSAVQEGKKKALDQNRDESDLGLLHRNESQTTIGRGRSAELPSTPRGPVVGKAPMMGTTEEEGHEGRAALPSAYQSYLGLSAPPLQRNASNSSTASLTSMGGSPIPIHSRTPSRTKRRSVGSTFSERLFSLDEEVTSSPIDYLSLLSLPSPSPLSTPHEQTLLESLATLGFDTGQIVHSIKTDACDSSAAIWWMLKRKADERERERIEVEHAVSSTSGLGRSGSMKKTASPLAQIFDPRVEEPLPSPGFGSDDESVMGMRTKTAVVPAATSEDRLGYYLQQTGESLSAPLLSYFPPVEPGSPSRKMVPRSKSRDRLAASPSPSPGRSPPSSLPGTPLLGVGTDIAEPQSEGKSKRARSASVSMLARATSAIGSTLALKKSTDAIKDDSKGDDGRGTPTTPLASLFQRKSSIPNDGDHTPSSPARSTSTPDLLGTPTRTTVPLPSPRPSPGKISASASQDTFNTITSEASSTRASKPAKKGTKGGIFTNFKMWFGDDRRKRKRNPSPMYVEGGSASRAGTASRRTLRQEGSIAGSPLKKPPLGSRRSSTTSIVPPSRRSSTNSIHRVRTSELPAHFTPSLGHHRRRSDSSRASNSDREHSRPPSLRSASGGEVARRPRHSKAGSVSSTGSFRVHTSPVIRRPPTTTTVRRHHGSQGRHHRNHSTSSSINTRHSSSSSVGEDDDRAEDPKSADPILEEDESAEEERALEERQRALRKLSGDFSSNDFPPTTIHPSSSSISRFSLDSHHSTGRHSPVIFSAHKTRHIFGAPSQPVPSSLTHRTSHSTLRPALRDVFANKDAEGEWVDDEADDLGGYGGGLGQAGTRSGVRNGSVSSTTSLFSSGTMASTHQQLESPAGQDTTYEGVNAFEGRYAGVGQDTPVVGMASGGAGAWRAAQANRAPAFRSAVVIEEEEEEEE